MNDKRYNMRLLQAHRTTVLPAAAGFMAALLAAVLWQQPLLLLLPFAALLLWVAVRQVQALWFLLLVTLSFSAEVQVTDTLGTDLPDEPLMLLLTFAALLAVIAQRKKLQAAAFKHPLFLLLAIQSCWYCVAAFFSSDITVSIKYCLAKIWYLVPFVLLPQLICKSKTPFRLLSLCLWLPLILIVPVILLRHAQTGFLFDTINNSVTPFFRNHVNYAAFLVCMIPVVYYTRRLIISAKTRNWLLLFLVVLLAALFLSFSRGAWLALAAGAAAGICLRRKMILPLLGFAAIAVVALVLWLSHNNRYLNYHHNYKKTIYHANFADHMIATFQNQDMSNAERFHRWIAGLRMSGEHPVTGFGPATFYDNYKPYTVSYFRTWVSANDEHSTVHNYFLLLLIEQGWPGLLLFVILITMFFVTAQRLYHRLTDIFYKTTVLCTAVIMAMILTLNLLSDLVETDKIGSLFYLCLGVLLVVQKRQQPNVA
jgi:O-antigen ligase